MNEESKDHHVRQEKIFRGELQGLQKEYSVHPLQNKERIEDTVSYKVLNTFKNEQGEDLDSHYDKIMEKYNLKKSED